jgi:hypothetical protein
MNRGRCARCTVGRPVADGGAHARWRKIGRDDDGNYFGGKYDGRERVARADRVNV